MIIFIGHVDAGKLTMGGNILFLTKAVARKGEYETGFEKDGQTIENAYSAKTQDVNRLIVVINKMDDPTINWEKKRYDEILKKNWL